MSLLIYIAETLDYIRRQAGVEVSDLAKTFADSVFRPRAPARPPQIAIKILEDLIGHRDLDAQRLRLERRTDDQSLDLTIRGATRLGYVVSLTQQQSVPVPDIEVDAVDTPDDTTTTGMATEVISQQTETPRIVGARGPPAQSPSPESERRTPILSFEGVQDNVMREKLGIL
ncbi:hypothetical protein FRC00_001549 [Tulasnella sp. 408]|nr:hypothetical protein FRC00_001549 [Tulasnella sp. 408]